MWTLMSLIRKVACIPPLPVSFCLWVSIGWLHAFNLPRDHCQASLPTTLVNETWVCHRKCVCLLLLCNTPPPKHSSFIVTFVCFLKLVFVGQIWLSQMGSSRWYSRDLSWAETGVVTIESLWGWLELLQRCVLELMARVLYSLLGIYDDILFMI